ncbi:(Fe-S)-binding protein [Desulfovibrio psychrotolerans]|uniref:Glycolate oxidase iron-sulfur subunit n=1 Tax=Desulfovibrio psychrotolerans TaxID=415242 RepID=A0A7J0BRM5_9BACT|nr:(Fe-S)-binding protein [Desulfovibrio psychrotolerans]GFM36320.1 glycolate oxidase iron-sulfur subunit [Desulfovibrio psychrotolerans]
MADLNKLAKMLQELDDMMVACMKCGMCQAVCPVFTETMKEADVTRGKIALLENLAHEMIRDADGVQERLNRCLLCGSCAANCPSGVKVMDIFLRGRTIVNTYMGLSPVKKAILRGMVGNPKLFNMLLDVGSKFQGIFTSQANELLGSSCSKFLSPIIGDRHFSPLAKQSLHSKYGTIDIPTGKSGIRVLFFPGCVADKMYTKAGEACLKVFRHHGVGVWMPAAQACCGIPALSAGDRVAYDKMVKFNVNIFADGDYDYIVAPCGSCISTIHELWPQFAGEYPEDLRNKIDRIAAKAMDINKFVVDVLGVKPAEAPKGGTKVTFHDSCHLKKSLGVATQPRDLIRMNPNYELVEMNEADRCCGCGGTFNLYHYDLSKKIGERKRENIVASEAKIVSTGCPACMMQMTDMLSQHNDSVAVKHSIEIYAETL